ncbi:MAG: YIP1 family protein [Bryobacteraceae bacterium]
MTQPNTTDRLSELQRISGVFTEPSRVFPDIARHGRWWLVIAILIVLSVLSVSAMVSRVGYDLMIEKALEQSRQVQEMSAEQRAQVYESQRKFMPIAFRVFPPIAILGGMLIAAGALLFSYRFLLDTDVKYREALNITVYASLPPAIVGNIMFYSLLYLKPPEEFDFESAGSLSIGSFLSRDTAAWLRSLANSMDLFTIWTIVLIAIGFSAFCGTRKLPFSRSLWGVLVPWLIYVLGKMGFAAIAG